MTSRRFMLVSFGLLVTNVNIAVWAMIVIQSINL